jgi:3-oxoacyl-[acyl-carrier protein] reductase
MPGPLHIRRALVTGGSRGIGAAIVRRLAHDGANVAFTYVNSADQATATADAARAIRADAADPDAVAAAVEHTCAAFGGIDILVNNAGVGLMAPVDEFSLADFDQTVAVNLRAAFVASQAAARHMASGGRIVMIGSCNAERMPFLGGAVYAMSKAGLVGLTKGLARDLGGRGITVNNVQPGPIDTDMNPANTDFAESIREQVLALPRYGTGDEVAAMVAYLCSPEAGFVTGSSLTIDGGFTA